MALEKVDEHAKASQSPLPLPYMAAPTPGARTVTPTPSLENQEGSKDRNL